MARQTKPKPDEAPKPGLVMGAGETTQEAVLDAFPAPDETAAEGPTDPRMKTHKVSTGAGHVILGIFTH